MAGGNIGLYEKGVSKDFLGRSAASYTHLHIEMCKYTHVRSDMHDNMYSICIRYTCRFLHMQNIQGGIVCTVENRYRILSM